MNGLETSASEATARRQSNQELLLSRVLLFSQCLPGSTWARHERSWCAGRPRSEKICQRIGALCGKDTPPGVRNISAAPRREIRRRASENF